MEVNMSHIIIRDFRRQGRLMQAHGIGEGTSTIDFSSGFIQDSGGDIREEVIVPHQDLLEYPS